MEKEYQKKIEECVLGHYFCNVGEADWPENPLEFLNKYYDADKPVMYVDNEYYEPEDKYRCMEVWEPFVGSSALLDDIRNSIQILSRLIETIVKTKESKDCGSQYDEGYSAGYDDGFEASESQHAENLDG